VHFKAKRKILRDPDVEIMGPLLRIFGVGQHRGLHGGANEFVNALSCYRLQRRWSEITRVGRMQGGCFEELINSRDARAACSEQVRPS
jgi:hypothetical protein